MLEVKHNHMVLEDFAIRGPDSVFLQSPYPMGLLKDRSNDPRPWWGAGTVRHLEGHIYYSIMSHTTNAIIDVLNRYMPPINSNENPRVADDLDYEGYEGKWVWDVKRDNSDPLFAPEVHLPGSTKVVVDEVLKLVPDIIAKVKEDIPNIFDSYHLTCDHSCLQAPWVHHKLSPRWDIAIPQAVVSYEVNGIFGLVAELIVDVMYARTKHQDSIWRPVVRAVLQVTEPLGEIFELVKSELELYPAINYAGFNAENDMAAGDYEVTKDTLPEFANRYMDNTYVINVGRLILKRKDLEFVRPEFYGYMPNQTNYVKDNSLNMMFSGNYRVKFSDAVYVFVLDRPIEVNIEAFKTTTIEGGGATIVLIANGQITNAMRITLENMTSAIFMHKVRLNFISATLDYDRNEIKYPISIIRDGEELVGYTEPVPVLPEPDKVGITINVDNYLIAEFDTLQQEVLPSTDISLESFTGKLLSVEFTAPNQLELFAGYGDIAGTNKEIRSTVTIDSVVATATGDDITDYEEIIDELLENLNKNLVVDPYEVAGKLKIKLAEPLTSFVLRREDEPIIPEQTTQDPNVGA